VLGDAAARQYVAGTAFHAYAGDVSAQTTVHNAYPDKDIYFTEITGGNWATNFGDNLVWNFQNIFIGGTRNWAKTALLWNLALDENGDPHDGGCMVAGAWSQLIARPAPSLQRRILFTRPGHQGSPARSCSHRLDDDLGRQHRRVS